MVKILATDAHTSTGFLPKFLSNAKIKQTALVCLAILAASVPLILSAAKLSIVSINCVSVCAAIFFLYLAWNIKDYDSPHALSKMRRQAKALSFAQIVELHGLGNALKILPEDEMREKFTAAHQNTTFTQMLKDYPLVYIQQHHLMQASDIQTKFVKELQKNTLDIFAKSFTEHDLESFKSFTSCDFIQQLTEILTTWKSLLQKYTEHIKSLDKKYPNRCNKILEMLDEAEKRDLMLCDTIAAQNPKKTLNMAGLQARLREHFPRERAAYLDTGFGDEEQLKYDSEKRQLDAVYEPSFTKARNSFMSCVLNF